jgi:hypothetical protein
VADYRDPQLSNEAANAGVDAICAKLNGGKLKIYQGPKPVSVDDPPTGSTLLAEPVFKDPAFQSAVNGVALSNPLTADPLAKATGTMDWFRAVKATGEAIWDGTIGLLADPQDDQYDMYASTLLIQENSRVSVKYLSYVGRKGQ